MASAAETEIRELISQWEQAVGDEDVAGIRASHSEDFLMFDVPPPFLSRGLGGYMETWKIFNPSQD
jgi:ketosteroid isomerase-like protein